MKEGMLQMSTRESSRLKTIGQVEAGQVSLRQAAAKMGMSYRQAKRVWKRYREGGDSAVVHRARGGTPNNQIPLEVKQQILGRYREVYRGFGPTLACEKLVEEDGLRAVSRETLRLWLLQEKLWERHRRRGAYRRRRPPRAHFGELVQLDGSFHRWFGEEHNECCLMNMVDDATGTTLAIMSEQETTEAAMRILWAWIERYGIPEALYCDQKNLYLLDKGQEPSVEEQLEGRLPKSAFGAACEKLGIQIISAHSPQAKGRVERKHGVFQDRFVKELHLRGAKRIEEANLILQGGFTEKLNRKFSHPALEQEDFHVALRPGQQLRDILCFEEPRSVAQDWVVRHENHFYQLLRGRQALPRAKSKVTVRRRLDGSIQILHRGKELLYEEFDPVSKGRRAAV
jgi:molybdenum-dependent DNA-binding transcriptional regulator ModE